MYLLLGSPLDECCLQVEALLRARGLAVRLVDDLFTAASSFSWRFAGPTASTDHGTRLQLADSPLLTERDISGVLVRDAMWRGFEGWSPNDAMYMSTEIQSALLGWLWSLPGRVVNRLPPWLWYRPIAPLAFWRPLLGRAGVPTPDTLISNDPARLRDWRDRHPAGAVFSPLTTSDHFLLSTPAEWDGLTAVARHSPVVVSEPHAQTYLLCIVGKQLFWNVEAPPISPQLTRTLFDFMALAGLDSVQLTLADLPMQANDFPPGGPQNSSRLVVTAVNPGVCFPLFQPEVQHLIAAALVNLLLEPSPGAPLLELKPAAVHQHLFEGVTA